MGGAFVNRPFLSAVHPIPGVADRTAAALGFPLRVPLVQAVLGSCTGLALPRAVSRAGALATVSVDAWRPAEAARRFPRIAATVGTRCLVAFTGDWEREEVLEHAWANGFRTFQTFWWNSERLVPRVRKFGGHVICQAGSMAQVAEALDHGASGVILQGLDAGGPVRSSLPLEPFLSQVRTDYGDDLVVFAGGGLATRHDVVRVLASGADAAVMGTRFLLTDESRSFRRDKARLAHAKTESLLLDTRLVGPWPCSPRRRLPTLRGEDRPGLFAGTGLSRIHRILPARDLVRQLAP